MQHFSSRHVVISIDIDALAHRFPKYKERNYRYDRELCTSTFDGIDDEEVRSQMLADTRECDEHNLEIRKSALAMREAYLAILAKLDPHAITYAKKTKANPKGETYSRDYAKVKDITPKFVEFIAHELESLLREYDRRVAEKKKSNVNSLAQRMKQL